MLKGKSVIELTDVRTGKKEIYEDENLVTEAIADVLNTNGFERITFQRLARNDHIRRII